MSNLSKNQQISQTFKETKQRRSKMLCKSVELKIDESKLSNKKENDLGLLFVEAKRFFNFCLADLNSEIPSSDSDLIKAQFIKVREMPLIEFTFFAGYLGFGDVDRFESGLDAVVEAPVLKDPYFGRIITMCLDFPIDVVSLTSETNNYQEEFGEWHDTILRNELTLHAGNGDLLTSPLAEFLKSLQIGTDDEDDFD